MTSSPCRRTPSLLLALVAVGALSGCGNTDEAAPRQQISPSSAVRSAEIDVADLPAGFTTEAFQPIGNDQLRGETSLELCWPSVTFASERQRLARHSTHYTVPGGQSAMGYELVAYKDGGAELALKEVSEAVESCPDKYVPFPEKDLGLPPVKSVMELLPASDDWLPGSVAVRETSYFEGERKPHNVTTIVYQRRGELLSILTFRTRDSADKYLAQVAKTQSEHLYAADLHD